MKFFEGASVAVAEIAAHLKQKPAAVEADALSLGLTVGTDWAGRLALSPADAGALVSGDARRQQEHLAAEQRVRAATADWEQRRNEVINAAYREVYLQKRSGGEGEAMAAGQNAARAAGREYELTVPRPRANAVHLTFVTEEEVAASGLVSRIKERISR